MSDEMAVRLQKVRKIYGLSQRELAKRAGVTNSSVSMIEQGRVSPSLSSLEKLLKGIPMSIKDFFTIDFNDKADCFFRSYQMFSRSDKTVDCYHLLRDESDERSQLSYEVYEPDSDTGENMLVDRGRSSGFVVQGKLNVIISGQIDDLDAGDGFIVEAGHPYRLRNLTDFKAILVINRSRN
ncbi:MAG: transcriptional regulator with XRE-family HTH domain [Candidatus Endobugula sp.]|jgi:transcriptional regulator with XRE-family HTH domain